MTVRKELIEQINLIITSIKTIKQNNPTPMVKNILKGYEEAMNLSNIQQRNNSKKTSLKLEIN